MQVGESAFITGASSGIGRSFAIKLSHLKHLTILGRNDSELAKTQTLALEQNSSLTIDSMSGDLTDTEFLERVIHQFRTAPPDTLILNAGGGPFGKFLDSPIEDQLAAINLNIVSNTSLLFSAIPLMLTKARKTGSRASLIIVTSHAAFMRVPHFAVYASAKSYLYQLGQTLALELLDEPIDIQILCPGATATQFSVRSGIPPMLSKAISPDQVADFSIQSGPGVQIITYFDKLIYLIYRFLPAALVDFLVLRTQRKFLNG